MSKSVLIGTVLALSITATASLLRAQDPASVERAGIPELLAEVRALRIELNRAAGASMRMQLLLARLTLQEGRIAALGRDIVEVQQQLLAADRERADNQTRLREMENIKDKGMLPPEVQQEVQQQVAREAARLREQLTGQAAREQHLRTQEAELLARLAAEQARWTDFNARLDDLERALPAASR
jgi:hypothetical protein